MRIGWIAAALLVAAAGAACSGTPSSPSTGPSTETFTGTLAVKGSSSYAFSPADNGTAIITLVSVTSGTSSQPTGTVVGVGIGVPKGEGCGLTSSVNVGPALVAQLSSPVSTGTYCAEIHDLGTLTGPVNFVMRIVHP